MSIFKPVTILFRGEEYSVAANKVFGLIEAVESHITMVELATNPRNTALAKAYHSALIYAGCNCSVEDVYKELFNAKGSTATREVISQIMVLMVPPEYIKLPKGDGEKKEEGEN